MSRAPNFLLQNGHGRRTIRPVGVCSRLFILPTAERRNASWSKLWHRGHLIRILGSMLILWYTPGKLLTCGLASFRPDHGAGGGCRELQESPTRLASMAWRFANWRPRHVLGDGPEWQAAGLRWGARNEADEDPRQIQASERTRRDGDAPRRLQADDPPRKLGDLAATGQLPKSRPAREPQGGPLTSSPKAFGLSRRPAVAQAVR
jgi:hypothetical protein